MYGKKNVLLSIVHVNTIFFPRRQAAKAHYDYVLYV